MDANLRAILEKRDKSLNEIEENLRNWDGSMEGALEVSEKNTEIFQGLEILEEKLNKSSHPTIYSDDYGRRLNKIVEAQDKLVACLRENRKQVLEKMKEINLKDAIRDSYVNKEIESIFIDKDL